LNLGDDGCELGPEVDGDEADNSPDAQCERAQWTDVDTTRADPRAATGSMPENISPAFLMPPSCRDEPLMSWFLFYVPLPLVVLVVKETNEAANKGIAWPRQQQWKHLRTGEFLRWLGLWDPHTRIKPLVHSNRRWCPLGNGRHI
jgi:hypothetical protein